MSRTIDQKIKDAEPLFAALRTGEIREIDFGNPGDNKHRLCVLKVKLISDPGKSPEFAIVSLFNGGEGSSRFFGMDFEAVKRALRKALHRYEVPKSLSEHPLIRKMQEGYALYDFFTVEKVEYVKPRAVNS